MKKKPAAKKPSRKPALAPVTGLKPYLEYRESGLLPTANVIHPHGGAA